MLVFDVLFFANVIIAPNNRDLNRWRNVESVGLTRKTYPQKIFVVPKFPRDMVQQHFDQKQISYNKTDGKGTITIVINKSDICNCISSNEDITIHVTTTPEVSSKRLIESLSEADVAEICSAKCSCCQKCDEFRKSANSKFLHMTPNNPTLLRPDNCAIYNRIPTRGQNVYSIPSRSSPMINEGFTSSEMKSLPPKRSRSLDSFPRMRTAVQMQPNMWPLASKPTEQKQRNHALRLIPSGNLNTKQKHRTMQPNVGQTQRYFSRHENLQTGYRELQSAGSIEQLAKRRQQNSSQTNVQRSMLSLNSQSAELIGPQQRHLRAARASGNTLQTPTEMHRSLKQQRQQNSLRINLGGPTPKNRNESGVVGIKSAERILDQPQIPIINQLPKKNGSGMKNAERFLVQDQQKLKTLVIDRLPWQRQQIFFTTNLGAEHIMTPKNRNDGIKIAQRVPMQVEQQRQNPPINRVLKPASLDRSNNQSRGGNKCVVTSAPNTCATNQYEKSVPIGNLKQFRRNDSNSATSFVQLGKKSVLINQPQNLSKNKFPERIESLPKMTTFLNQNALNLVPREPLPDASKIMSSGGPVLRSGMQRISTPSTLSQRPQTTYKQRIGAPSSHRASTSLVTPHQMKNIPPKQVVVQRQSSQIVLKNRSMRHALNPQMKNCQQPNFLLQNNFPRQQQPHFALKEKSPTLPSFTQRESLIPVRQMQSLSERNSLPKQNLPVKQQDVFRLQRVIPRTRATGNSLFPVPIFKNVARQNIFLRKNFQIKRPVHTSLKRRSPTLSLRNFIYSTARKDPQLTSNNIGDPTRRRRPAVPLRRFTYSSQRKNAVQSQLARNRLGDIRKQTFLLSDQRQKRNEIRRMNQEKLQSSLPVGLIKQVNQISKNGESPTSVSQVTRIA